MGIYDTLVNLTKEERISFERLPVVKKREIADHPAAETLVAWYVLDNSSDLVGATGDEIDSSFPGLTYF